MQISAAPGHHLGFEYVDTDTFAVGGQTAGPSFGQLLTGVTVDDVTILGAARTSQAWSVIINPGPPRSLIIRTAPYPSVSGGMVFLAHPGHGQGPQRTPDSYSYLTGELQRRSLSAAKYVAP